MTEKPLLVIGNRNYSSWSLRAAICLYKAGIEIEERLLPLDTDEFYAQIGEYSPSGCVPVLWDEGQCIWDSLAIAEYVNDKYAQGRFWPEDVASRAMGRSMAAEMHSGFPHLRAAMPMNIRAQGRRVEITTALQQEIERVASLWQDARQCHADLGPWLLGEFSLVDAMYVPVVLRFRTYGVPSDEISQAYCEHWLADPDLQRWMRAAEEESWVVVADEAGEGG